MTVLAGGLVLAVTIALGGLTAQVGATAADRARAQSAADAAALAAAAESGPYGRNLQTAVAREYAEANGALLIGCICDSGSSAVQVRVEIGGVEAEARAVLDASLIGPLAPSSGGLQPALSAAVGRLIAASSGSVYVVSGYRDSEHQRALWEAALIRYGSPEAADDWVAPPGHSMHERGLAVDLGGDLDAAVALIADLGLPLWRPMAHEPWHFELTGSR